MLITVYLYGWSGWQGWAQTYDVNITPHPVPWFRFGYGVCGVCLKAGTHIPTRRSGDASDPIVGD